MLQVIDENPTRKAQHKEADDNDLVFDKNKRTYKVFMLPLAEPGNKHTIKRTPEVVLAPPLPASIVQPPLAQHPPPVHI